MTERIKVEIYGQTYNMQGDLDAAYVQELAAYVDEKMHAVAAAARTVDSVRVAVLAALAIADEFQTLQRSQKELRGAVRDRAQRCLGLVERALKQTA
jgi:cell division protein ZapA